ncbi:MAG: transketolase [Christensenellales bacterium]
MTEYNKEELERFAANIRLKTLGAITKRGFGHVGGAMSIADVLAALYGYVMRIDPKNPSWEERDWLVCSKGHAGPALYAALAIKGYFDEKVLDTLNRGGTILPSHCDRNKTPGIDMTTGSLGQGISTAIGVALGNRLDNKDNYTYLILGDGELNEGQIWEGAMFANHFKLDNLIVFVDYNKQQLDGYTKDIMDIGDIGAKFAAFGWDVIKVDGHNPAAICDAVKEAKSAAGKPSVIILDTFKGRGCTFAEGLLDNHHMVVSEEQGRTAMDAVRQKLSELE